MSVNFSMEFLSYDAAMGYKELIQSYTFPPLFHSRNQIGCINEFIKNLI